MKIKKSVIKREIRKAHKEGRQWARVDHRYTYAIMIDADDAAIWCDVFTNCNDYKVYHSDEIHNLSRDTWGRTIAEEEESLTSYAAELLVDAGWEIEE